MGMFTKTLTRNHVAVLVPFPGSLRLAGRQDVGERWREDRIRVNVFLFPATFMKYHYHYTKSLRNTHIDMYI